MRSEIKNVVFDLGGVLVDWNPRYLYRKIFSSPETMENFLATVCTQEWNEKQDAGRSFAEGTAELISMHPHYQTEIEFYDARWEEMLNGPISATVQILERLSSLKSHRLLALSNWSKDKFPIAEKNFPFLKLFEDIVVSGKVGFKKPDHRIFNYLCEKYSILPTESVFIDDVQSNLDAAAQLGFKTILFTSADQLEKQMIAMGILRSA